MGALNRLDVYLSKVCLLKSRTLAKEACSRGKVTVNGELAKGSRVVREGDRIFLDLGLRRLEVEVLEVPTGQVAKRDAPGYYTLLRDEHLDPE